MTGRNIYDLAVQLLACKNSNGNDNPDCADYMSRSPSLLNILLAETLQTDRLLRRDRGAHSVPISSLDDKVACHELLAYGVLSYGLASLLVADEDPDLSRSLYARYLAGIENVRSTVSAVTHRIEDRYKYHG